MAQRRAPVESAELVADTVAAARVIPRHIVKVLADHPAGAAFQASIGRERNLAGIQRVAVGRAAEGARLGLALLGADFGILDMDVRTVFVDDVPVLIKLVFYLDSAHRKALASLNASPTRPKSERRLANDFRIW